MATDCRALEGLFVGGCTSSKTCPSNEQDVRIRRALCPGRVRSCHHPSSHVPGCSFCSFFSFLSIPGAIGSKSVLPDGSLAAPWRLPGGLSLWVATFFFLLSLGKNCVRPLANGPEPPTDALPLLSYAFLVQFSTTYNIFYSLGGISIEFQ